MDYSKFPKKLAEEDASIFLVGIGTLDTGKVLGINVKQGGWSREQKDLSGFIARILITLGIPGAGEQFFGASRYVIVNYREFETINFRIFQNRMLVTSARMPFNHGDVIQKALEYSSLSG